MRSLARRLASTTRRPWPSRPVRIALAITELDVGGAEKALVALASRLDRRRWDPTAIALGPEAPLAAPLRAAGVAVECLDVNPGNPPAAVFRLAAALRRTRPELIQSFLFHANVATRVAALIAGRPWVVGGLRVAERGQRWHVRLERLTSRLAAGSVCVSEGVRAFSEGSGGWPADRLVVIPNSVDPAPFDRAAVEAKPRPALGLAAVPDRAHLVLYVGRLDAQKDVATLLEAADRVVASDPGLDWHLALAGDGPERGRLRRDAAARPRLEGRVHWLGHRRDVPALLHAADLLVLPSRWEGMPNAVLEAMAARRAVVATNVEGTSELIEPGRTGWLVPPGDPDALARALSEAAADPERLRRYGRAGRACVETRFSPATTVRAYERLWAGLLGYDLPIEDYENEQINKST